MTIYLFLTGVLLFVGFYLNVNATRRRQRNYLLFVFSLFVLVASLRSYNVGIDTEQYYRYYSGIGCTDYADSRYEFGFFALCKLLHFISPDPQLLLAVSSCFISFSVGRFLYRNSGDVIFSSCLYLTLNLFAMYLNAMRQALAIAVILFGIEYLKIPRRKNRICYILTVLLAMQFHISAAVMLLPLFFIKRRYTAVSFLFTIGISAAVFVLHPVIVQAAASLSGRFDAYLTSQYGVSNYFASVINLTLCLVILLFGLVFAGKSRRPAFGFDEYLGKNTLCYDLNAYMLSFAVPFLVMAVRTTFLSRFSLYFTVFYLPWIPNVIKSITDRANRVTVALLVFLLTLFYYGIVAWFRPEWYGVIPYEFFWNV